MPEENKSKLSEEELAQLKQVEFYSASMQAWFGTKFELDKSLLTLASAGIGLLVTLATAVGATEVYTAIMYGFAVVSFLVCVLSVLAIFGRNAKHLEELTNGNYDRDKLLPALDKIAQTSFIFGVGFTMLVGLFSALENVKTKENSMSDNEKKITTTPVGGLKKSVDGAGKMFPTPPPSPSNQDSSSGQSGNSGSSNQGSGNSSDS